MRIYARGEQIGPYEIIEALPRGGMGAVYVAKPRPKYNGPPQVALKMANKEHNDFLKYEIEQMQRLSHPNVLTALPIAKHMESSRDRPVFDAKVDPNSLDSPYYIIVEYMRGGSLAQSLKLRGKLTPDEAIEIALQVTEGLMHIHAHNIVHLDIKDTNILLRQPLSRWQARVPEIVISDFGIAWSVGREPTEDIYGSQYFTAPERAAGEPPHPYNDIFSLGVLLYQMVIGTPPFENTSVPPGTPLERRLHPAQLNPAVTAAFERVILRALATNPHERYQTAEELRADLERLPRAARPSKIRLPLMTGLRDYAVAACIALALVLLLAIGVAAASNSTNRTPDPTSISSSSQPALTATNLPATSTLAPLSATAAPVPSPSATPSLRATSTLIPSSTGAALPPSPSPLSEQTTQPKATPRPVATVDSRVAVPDVRGRDVGDARARLEGLGFRVQVEEEYGEDVASVCNGWVAYSTPSQGTMVARRSVIRLHYRSFNLPNNPRC